jgi:hypothetical protein
MDFPQAVWPPLNTITPWSTESIGSYLRAVTNGALSAAASATVVANQAYFYPFQLFQPATVVKCSWLTGATNTGNVDMGVYDRFNLVFNTGSQGLGTANVVNTADITDVELLPGPYFMAITFSNSAGTTFQVTPLDEAIQSTCPIVELAVGGFGLPATSFGIANSTVATPKVHAIALHFNTLV